MDKNELTKLILNPKNEKPLITGTVTQLYPMKVELIPDDTPVTVIPTTGLIRCKVGSRVLLQRFGNKLIATHVIGNPWISQLYGWSSDVTVNNTTTMTSTGLTITIPDDGYRYKVEFFGIVNSTSTTPNVKFEWQPSGSYTSYSLRFCRGYSAAGSSTLPGGEVKASYFGYTTDVHYPVNDVNDESIIYEKFILKSYSGGNAEFTLNFAQSTATAVDTTLESASYVELTQIQEIS